MKIYEAKNHILIHTEDISPSQHSHMAAHIIVSLGGRIEIQSAGQKHFCYGGLVPAGQIHKVNTNNNGVLVFLYDCSTSIAKQIKNFQVIPDEICKTISNLYNTVKDSVNSDNYYSFEKECLKLMGINCRENRFRRQGRARIKRVYCLPRAPTILFSKNPRRSRRVKYYRVRCFAGGIPCR